MSRSVFCRVSEPFRLLQDDSLRREAASATSVNPTLRPHRDGAGGHLRRSFDLMSNRRYWFAAGAVGDGSGFGDRPS